MTRWLRPVLGMGLALVLLAGTVAGLRAQQGTTELRGRVIDEQGGVLPGVAVVRGGPVCPP